MTSRSLKPASRSERGYILITLLLFVALIAIAAVVTLPVVAFQVKRDREEELIHRGVQYSRAMKHYVKKFGRYPTRIEDLENTNQVRFLRRRYKDPFTGKDFKILRMGDVQMMGGPGLLGGGLGNPLNPASKLPGGTIAQISGPGANGVPTTTQLAGSATVGVTPSNPPSGPNTAPGSQDAEQSDESGNENGTNGPGSQGGSLAAAGPGAPGVFGAVAPGGAAPGSGQGAQVFGGGPMVGVASTSKDKSIRIFNKKDHYDQWMFIYDPSSDRGGLLTTPSQPSLQGATTLQQGGLGTPGATGFPNSGIQAQPGQPVQPMQPGMQTPQMPPDQEQEQ
jgi:type II secretory pathway pseudopilin PulG